MSRAPAAAVRLTLLAVTLAAATVPARAQTPSAPLTQLQFDIVGVRLVVDPPALTVPKQIATQINTSLLLPGGAGPQAQDAIATLTHGALVEGTLRGPSIPPTRITTRPGEPLPLPPFALPGDYFLDGLRLVKDGVALLDASAPDGRPATTIPILVINEIFVTNVTSRPLTLAEIKEKGIVIDQHNFQAVNFQVAFNIDGQPFTIQMPVALPTRELINAQPNRALLTRRLSVVNQQLAAQQTTLPPAFDRPGLNFSIAALPFFPVVEDPEDPDFEIPPVTGLIVIPGNVAFLNQFFSVVLMVTNVAPDGTPLVLREVRGTVQLPTGLDRIAAVSYESPGDDPLRLARIDGQGQLATVRVVQPGADGDSGTADDIESIPPQRNGEGEFLLEGLKEGGHIFDISIEAVLDGLPSGPVRIAGQAAGAVFVRNPTFAVTLAHPRTVRSGEPYDVYATVTNTSSSTANLVSVNLDPLGISGAQLLSDPGVSFDTIPAGQAVTARFRLVAQQTGDVTASSFTGEADGGIRLFTGVGERGVPLAPNAIVLPASTDALPDTLVAAAQRVLGQAFSIATAPAEALPPGVQFVKRQTVIDRGLELAEAGQRLRFGDTPGPAVRDLLLDWLGARMDDPGFDQLMRTTDAGRAMLSEIAAVLGPEFAADGLSAQQALVEQALARTAPLTAMVRAPADRAPVQLRLLHEDGRETRPDVSTLPRGGLLSMTEPGALAAMAVVVAPDPARYTIEAISPEGGVIDVGVTTPAADPSQAMQLRFAGIALDPGGVVRVVVDLSSPGAASALVDRDGDGTVDHTTTGAGSTLVEEPLRVIDVLQLESSFFDAPGNPRDPATYGLLVGALFNKPTTEATAESPSNYAVDANTVAGAAQQVGGRLVYLYLERPVGALVPRSLTVRNVVDTHAGVLPETTRPIRMVLTDGARVFGQVREAGGSGVPLAFLSTVIHVGENLSFNVSAIHTDSEGSFAFDFVPRIGTLELTAQHPQTRAVATLQARIRGAGESLLLNPTFLGSGSVRGRVLAADGATPVPHATVALFPGSILRSRGLQVRANGLGEFIFNDVPVGVFTLRAIDGRNASGQTTGVLEADGSQPNIDVVVVDEPSEGGTLVGRVFLSDGVTPASGFSVFVGQYNRSSGTVAAVDQVQTDSTGSFAFVRPIPGRSYDVVAVDAASGQVGATRAEIIPLTTTAVSIVMESTGAVEGVVFAANGLPLPGALVAGGLALVATDTNGFFRIEGVPAGKRKIEAGDPVSRRRGSAEVNVLPGQTVTASITLEARATFTGRVLDAAGNPVPRASVRIPTLGGFTFVIANNQGVFTFPDMPLGDYQIQAPGPSAESLIAFLETNGYDASTAFTSGDGPPAPPPLSSDDEQGVIAAYQNAVRNFYSVDESFLGLPMADLGGFGWSRVRLLQDSVTQVADIRFLSRGTVSGHTADAAGRPTGALVRVSALKVGLSGLPLFGEIARVNTDAATGVFSFEGIPRFDLATFQTAGVRGGDFTLEAAQQFSPAIVQFRDQLNSANPDRANIRLQFPAAAVTNGTASGIVLMPDGITPAPAGTLVQISFGDLAVTTDAEGRFASLLPIPAGSYTFTAQTPTGALRGQALAAVPAGGTVDVTIRLLGLGDLLVQVRRPTGEPVPNALIRVRRGSFPRDQANGVAAATGSRRFVNLTEGPFSVDVEEPITGLKGRASGVITRGAEAASIVTITASGQVTGTFVSAANNAPIPFAQVALSGSVQAYTTTDVNGRFELIAVPIGAFTVEASDPASGRIGRAQGRLSFEGQSVDVVVTQVPRGTVAGYVLNADGVGGIASANVELTTSSIVATRLQVATLADGSFRIAGVAAGTFTLRARDPQSGAEGTAIGALSAEGETVERNVVLQPFGSIRVSVLNELGEPAPNVSLQAAGRTAAVDTSGQFTFENLTLGTYGITAVSLADQFNGGRSTAVLDEANDVVAVTVQLRGVAPVTVRVVESDGSTPVSSARVTLNARGGFAGEPAGPTASALVGFTSAGGGITFPSVPVGDYFARGESGPLGGVVTGSTPGVGQGSSVTVTLGASGSIAGRVLLPDSVTPAAQALVTLNFQSQSGLQSGVLQVTTDLTGRFLFGGIPIGAFTVSAFEVVSNGVRTRTGSLTSDGEVADLGDLTLDNAGPLVASVSPANGSTGVAPSTPIAITFSEPMRATSFTTATIRVSDGAAAVPGSLTLSADRLVATFTPSQPLRSGGVYSVVVRGAPDGPRDESNIGMADPFVSGFAVRDVIAPAIVSMSPAADAREVQPEAVIRVTFSEPVTTAAVTLRTSSGQVVPAQFAFTAGNTAVALSPVDFLPANAAFTVSVDGVTDTAGNVMPGGPATFTFNTVDTIAPLVTALGVQGVPRAGAMVTLVPSIAGGDIARVEYAAATLNSVVSTAPFAASLTIPGGAPDFSVTVRAIDQVGNRSEAFALTIQVQENLAPTLQLVNVSGQTVVPQGASLPFDVVAADDVGIAQVLLSSIGAVAASFTADITGAPTGATRRFNVGIPLDAAPGASLTIQAAVVDTAGNRSAPATLALSVRDGVAPSVTIQEPAAGAQVVPAQTLLVVVNATDAGGMTTMTLTCNPVLVGCAVRPIAPAATATTQTFSVDVPASLNAPASITLLATATDAEGNTGQAGRTVTVTDVVPPALTSLQAASGSTRVLAGSSAAIRADATDNIGVVSFDFTIEGAVTGAGSASVMPPSVSATTEFVVDVPASAPNGGTITIRAIARDAAGNASGEITLTLTVGDTAPPAAAIAQPADGSFVTPGQPVTVQASATDDVAVAQIVLRVRGVVTVDETRTFTPAQTPAAAAFIVPIAADTTPGAVTITIQAFDAAGNASAELTRSITVRDATAPVTAIVSPAPEAQVDPRMPLTVSVQASDAVGVAEVGLTTTGLVPGTTTRPVNPPQTSAAESFTITFAQPPIAGGQLTLTGSARDAAGNQALSPPVTVTVLDVVPPAIAAVAPADGAAGVALDGTVVIAFTEPMDRASLTANAIRLLAGATPLNVSLVIAANDRSVTLTPAAPLAVNTLHSVTIDTTVRDRASNALAASMVSTFRTASPDATAPTVVSTNPAAGAVGIGSMAPISVTFSEPVAPASVTAASFRISVDAATVAGAFSFSNGGSTVSFTPAIGFPFDTVVVLELTGAITDLSNNSLVNADGSAIVTPITITFVTGAFAIVSPAGTSVIEDTRVTLEANAASALTVASVVYTVNGVAQPAVTAPFTRLVRIPTAAASPTVTVIASARDAANAEIARAERSYAVLHALVASPKVLGLGRGATGSIRLSLAQPAAADLAIALSTANPAVATVSPAGVVLPAGQTAIDVEVTACSICPLDPAPEVGSSLGTTPLVASSERGTASASISISDPVPGRNVTPMAGPVGATILQAPSAGGIVTAAGLRQMSPVTVLASAATATTPVTVSSSNPAVASATATDIGAGQRVTTLTIDTGVEGVAVLTIRAGTEVRSITVVVGAQSSSQTAGLLAPPVGITMPSHPLAAHAFAPMSTSATVSIILLPAPAAGSTVVTVTSDNPSVAQVANSPLAIAAGSRVAAVDIVTGAAGTATLTLEANGQRTRFTVHVDTAPVVARTPLASAPPVGVSVIPSRGASHLRAPAGTPVSASVEVRLLASPRAGPLAVTVTTSDPSILSLGASTTVALTIDAGSLVVPVHVNSLGTEGAALLTFEFDGVRHDLLFIVGNPPPSQLPAVLSPVIGVRVP